MVTAVDATATRFEFETDRDTNSHAGSVGLQFHPRAMISGTAGLGYRVLDPLSVRNPSFSASLRAPGSPTRCGTCRRSALARSATSKPPSTPTARISSTRSTRVGPAGAVSPVRYRRQSPAHDHRVRAVPHEGVTLPALDPDVVRMATVNIGMPIAREVPRRLVSPALGTHVGGASLPHNQNRSRDECRHVQHEPARHFL